MGWRIGYMSEKLGVLTVKNMNMMGSSLVPRPLPPEGEGPGTKLDGFIVCLSKQNLPKVWAQAIKETIHPPLSAVILANGPLPILTTILLTAGQSQYHLPQPPEVLGRRGRRKVVQRDELLLSSTLDCT